MAGIDYEFSAPDDVDLVNNTIDLHQTPSVDGVLVKLTAVSGSSPVITPSSYDGAWFYMMSAGGTKVYLSRCKGSTAKVTFSSAGSGTSKLTTCIYSVQAGNWADGSTWVGGVKPQDSEVVMMRDGHDVCMNDDMSGMTNGILYLFMDHNGSDPPMLYFKDGVDAYLKFRPREQNVLHGSLDTVTVNSSSWKISNRARILVNANGNWNSIAPLSYDYRVVIDLKAQTHSYNQSAFINAAMISIRTYCAQPDNEYVEVYGDSYDVEVGEGKVTISPDYEWSIDLGATPPAEGTAVRFYPIGDGVLPTGIEQDTTYYIAEGAVGNVVKLCYSQYGDFSDVIKISDYGSGSMRMVLGVDIGETVLNTVQDVSEDDLWSTVSGDGDLAYTNMYPGIASTNVARYGLRTLAGKGANTITLNSGVTEWLAPGSRVWLCSRNVYFKVNGVTTGYVIAGYPGVTTPESHITGRFQPTTYDIYHNYGCALNLCDSIVFDGIVVDFAKGGDFVQSSVDGIFIGAKTAISGGNEYWGVGVNIDGGTTFTGVAAGCDYGITMSGYQNATEDMLFNGTAMGCLYAGVTANGELAVADGIVIGCYSGVDGWGAYFTGDIKNCYNGSIAEKSALACNVSGCANAYVSPSACNISGTITRCHTASTGDVPYTISNLDISYCTYAFYGQTGQITANSMEISNCLVEYAGGSYGSRFRNVTSYTHNNIPGAVRTYSPSGIAYYHDGSEVEEGREFCHAFWFPYKKNAGAGIPVFIEWDMMNFAETTVNIVCFAKNYPDSYDGSLIMTNTNRRVRWAIVDASADPLFNPNAEYIDYWESSNMKGWQQQTLTCTKESDQPIKLRVWVARDSPESYWIAAYAYCYVIGAGGISFGIVGTNVT